MEKVVVWQVEIIKAVANTTKETRKQGKLFTIEDA